MNGGERDSHGEDREVVYCLVPRALAPKLHEALRKHFRDDPGVEVIVERRGVERRRTPDRRSGIAGKTPPGPDRRAIRHGAGRRAGERRAPLAPVEEPPELPRKARPHAEQLAFVRRAEPSGLQREDRDTARLVTRFQAGEQDAAFSTIYTRYFDRVYNYLRVILDDHDEAEDGAQTVFTNAFEALPRYKLGKEPFRAWLFTIARNWALAYLRKAGRIELVEPDEIDRLREESAADHEHEPEPGLPVLSWISDGELSMLMERLPLVQRQVLLLRFALDLTSPQVGNMLDRSPDDVRGIQGRAFDFLRDRLIALGRDPKTGRPTKMRGRLKHAPVLRMRRFSL